MLYLPLADLFINPGALLITGICIGLLMVALRACGNLLLVPVLNLFGLPAVYAVSAGVGVDFSQSAAALFSSSQKYPHRRLAFSLSAFGLTGAAAGCLLLIFLSSHGLASPTLRIVYSFVLIVCVIGLLMFRFLRKDWPGTILPRLFNPRPADGTTRFIYAVKLQHVAVHGLLTGFLTGFLGLGVAFFEENLLNRHLGAPPPVARDTARLSGLITGAGVLFIWAVAGRLEVVALFLLLTGIFIGRSTGSFLSGKINRSIPVFTACLLLMGATSVCLWLKQAGSAETAGTIALSGLLLLCILLILTTAGYNLIKRLSPERIKPDPAPQQH